MEVLVHIPLPASLPPRRPNYSGDQSKSVCLGDALRLNTEVVARCWGFVLEICLRWRFVCIRDLFVLEIRLY